MKDLHSENYKALIKGIEDYLKKWKDIPCSCIEKINTVFLMFFLFIYLFILFLAALGLCCCTQAFSSCGEQGLLFIAVHRLLIAVASHCGARALGTQASLVVAHSLHSCGSRALERSLSSCGAWA